jgi:hypothetical protein
VEKIVFGHRPVALATYAGLTLAFDSWKDKYIKNSNSVSPKSPYPCTPYEYIPRQLIPRYLNEFGFRINQNEKLKNDSEGEGQEIYQGYDCLRRWCLYRRIGDFDD